MVVSKILHNTFTKIRCKRNLCTQEFIQKCFTKQKPLFRIEKKIEILNKITFKHCEEAHVGQTKLLLT